MNVLLINGSPHAHGCTDAALQEIAKALNADGIETTIYHIGAVPVGGCVGCGGCAKAGHCVFGGPVVDVLPLVEKADGIVFGAPVHYSTAAASMLGFMHRLGYSAGRLLAQKPAAIVTSARRAGTTSALEALEKVPQFCQMPLISSTYWPMVHGSNAEQAALDEEGMQIMRNLAAEGKSILFISHKLAEIMAVADRCSVLRKGKYIGTVETANTTAEELSAMMVGRNVNFHVEKKPAEPGDVVLEVKNMTMASKVHKNNAVKNVSFQVRRGEIVCIAGIDGNGQTELVYGLTGLEPLVSGELFLCGQDITHTSIRKRSTMGMSHIPEDRHKHGLVLDYSLEDNMILQRYFEPEFTDKAGFLRRKNIRGYAERLIEQYDVRSGQGPVTIARSMSGGNQQKAIVAREIDKDPELLVAVQPTRGLDVGAIEYIHRQLVAQRDEGKAVLLVSLELDEVMDVPDRILVMYEGEIVGELDPKTTTQEELGLYMAGAKRDEVKA